MYHVISTSDGGMNIQFLIPCTYCRFGFQVSTRVGKQVYKMYMFAVSPALLVVCVQVCDIMRGSIDLSLNVVTMSSASTKWT